MAGAPAVATLVLLDTNAYLRLAKRIRPLLGVPFGQKGYVLTTLADVEDEVRASGRLRYRFPWFDADPALAQEHLAKRMRLSSEEREQIDSIARFLHDWVPQGVARYLAGGGSPPGATDCRVVAFESNA